uniref:Putative ribonuclease H-like domain-containing protein n=1 Tax=Tanacetum cinerariifolium TaxID=118510 RepID=A0A6L2LHB2_TANCI|nr:putative ribonuclease H-like domain-containing protein [Tanacetum cinerariifolium]
METQNPLLKEEDGEEVDAHMYRSMIGSLMYLTSSRPDIMFSVCACVRYQVNPKVSHLYAVKRIFRYLKGQLKFRLWYPKDSPFDLVAYNDSDYDGESLKRKSTTGGMTYYCQLKVNAARHNLQLLAIPADPQHTPTLLQPSSSQPQKTQKPKKAKRKDTQVPQRSGPIESVADEAVYKELDDRLVRLATTASSLEAGHDSEAMRDTIAQTSSERMSKLSNDSLLTRDNTLQSDEDRLKLNELMELCTTLQSRVFDLEKTKTTQALEIDSLKRRVKKLEKKQRSRTHKLKRLYKVGLTARVESSDNEQSLGEDASKQERISDIDANEKVGVAQVQVSTAATTATISIDEVTLAQALAELKHTKPKAKAKGIVFHEPEESTTITKPKSQDKGKAIMIEEHVKLKKKDQIMLDEEVALKLQAELQAKFDKEEQRLAKESAKKEQEVNSALIKEYNDIQAKINVDYLLAQRLQIEEQQKLIKAEKATLFMQFLVKKRKFFVAKAAEEKRNKPPTQAQQRKIMFTYLQNMEGKKLKDLKNNLERAGTELEQESSKKQKIDYDKETAELNQLVKIILDEEGVAIDAIPLAVKPPSIVDWKIHKEAKKSYYKIIRVDGSSKIYLVFSYMLKSFNREDVKTLWRLVKVKHGSTWPEDDYERVLWGDLKTPYEIWHEKAPKLSHLRFGVETMGYYFYYPLENNNFVARNAEFFENNLMVQEASGSHGLLVESESDVRLELIQEDDTQPSKNTSKKHDEIVPTEVDPQNVKIPFCRSARIPQAPNRYGFYVDVEEYELGDLNEPPNYMVALSDPESDKWLEAINTKMQSMKDNQVWVLVDLPPNG